MKNRLAGVSGLLITLSGARNMTNLILSLKVSDQEWQR